jgi:hypothetical protein
VTSTALSRKRQRQLWVITGPSRRRHEDGHHHRTSKDGRERNRLLRGPGDQVEHGSIIDRFQRSQVKAYRF